MKRNGFTLIELMIIVAIIGILLAIVIPNYFRFQCRAQANEMLAANYIEQIDEDMCDDAETVERLYDNFLLNVPQKKEKPEPTQLRPVTPKIFSEPGWPIPPCGWCTDGKMRVCNVPDGCVDDSKPKPEKDWRSEKGKLWE